MNKLKVYISGQITGLDENEYKKLFNEAEDVLIAFGYDPVNPVALDEAEDTNGWTWHDFMKRDIKLLCGCDYIYLLPNWRNSRGAKFEYMIADMLQIPCLNLQDIQEKMIRKVQRKVVQEQPGKTAGDKRKIQKRSFKNTD